MTEIQQILMACISSGFIAGIVLHLLTNDKTPPVVNIYQDGKPLRYVMHVDPGYVTTVTTTTVPDDNMESQARG